MGFVIIDELIIDPPPCHTGEKILQFFLIIYILLFYNLLKILKESN
jgi:hypothetical protein